MPSGGSKVDRSVLIAAMAYLGLVLAALLMAEAISDGDSNSLVSQIMVAAGPIGAVLVLTIKSGEATTRIEDKTDVQTTKLTKIERAVNGEMGAQFDDLRTRTDSLEGVIAETRQDVREIKDTLQRIAPMP